MAYLLQELEINQDIATATLVADVYTPPANAFVEIRKIATNVIPSLNIRTKLIWDYAGTQQQLWAGNFEESYGRIILERNMCDGVKQIALLVDNGEDGSITVAAKAYLKVSHT